MVFRLSLRGADGSLWPLLNESHRGVYLREGNLSDLVGTVEEASVVAVGVTGEVAWAGDETVPAMDGSIPLVVDDSAGSKAETFARFSSALHPSDVARLELTDDKLSDPGVPWWCRVRLSGRMPVLALPNEPDGFEEFDVSVRSREGVWLRSFSKTGPSVTVTNTGDVHVWVKIAWAGAGGDVTMPSGAKFTLPPTGVERVMHLNTFDGGAITDRAGRLDNVVWSKLTAPVFPEMVPRGTSKTFTVPTGAKVEWEIGVCNPWKR